jgi:glycosyltransferase involved in cell wall biosynthesis
MKIEEPLVSIITPTYNHERYIRSCIESVLSQTHSNFEQIIIDDASTDGTAEIISQYVEKDRRIKFIQHNTNYGIYKLADIYNKFLNFSKGEFIAILEGDDLWPPDKLEKQLKLFSNSKVVVTWGAGKIIDKDGNELGTFPKAWEKWPDDVICNRPPGKALKILLHNFFLLPSSSLMFRRQQLQEIGGFWQPDGYFAVDYPTCIKMSLKGEFLYSKEILGYWRNHQDQVTSTLAHASTTIVSDEFLKLIPEHQKKELGIDKINKYLTVYSWWIKGRRLMASGQMRKARWYFTKTLIAGQGLLSLKAGVILVISFLMPSLLQYKLKTPLNSITLLKKIIRSKLSE